MRSPHRTVLVAALVAVTACAAVLGIEDTTDMADGGDGGPATPPRDREIGDALEVDEAAAGDAETRLTCPSSVGSKMVLVEDSFCIDATEVTNAHYKQFIDKMAGNTTGQPPECAFNTSFLPIGNWPYGAGREDIPINEVTWCSARAYCEWAGKRLCGAPGTGAPVKPGAVADAAADEWYAACSHSGQRTYPYGNAFSPKACNGGELDAGGPVKAASMPGCEGGYAGTFDMSGNVEEWENACEGTTRDGGPYTDVCYVRGGTYRLVGGRLTCTDYGRLFRGNTAGIRCCASPVRQ